MPTPLTLLTFVCVVGVFAAIPGPSNLFVVGQGLRSGRRAALLAATGCALGASIYVVATSLGLAAVLASSATALSVLHYVGGVYLIVLAVRTLRDRGSSGGTEPPPVSEAGCLRRGLLVELSNPKVALFFLAFFPQFIHREQGPVWSQILVLGVTFCVVGLISDSLYAVGSGALRGRLVETKGRVLARANRLSGAIYLALGAWAIWSGSQTRGS